MAVTTSLNSGTLTLTGDAGTDDIAIVGTANPGELTVTGRNGTSVNGTPNGSVTIPGVTGSLNVNLQSGDDVVSMDNVYLAGDLVVNVNLGNNTVTLGALQPVSTGGKLWVLAGGGRDIIQVDTTSYHVFAVGELYVLSGAGSDFVSIYGASSQSAVRVVGSGIANITGTTSGGPMPVDWSGDVTVTTSAANGGLVVTNLQNYSRTVIDIAYSGSYIEVNRRGWGAYVNIARCQTRQINVLDWGPVLNHDETVASFIALHGNYIVGPPYGSYANQFYPAHNEALYVNLYGLDDSVVNHDIVEVSYNVVVGAAYFQLARGDDALTFTGNRVDAGGLLDGGLGVNRLSLAANSSPSLTAIHFV